MKKRIFQIVLPALLLPGPVLAAEVDDILASQKVHTVMLGELRQAVEKFKMDGAMITALNAFLISPAPGRDTDPILNRETACLVSQLRELRKVDWNRYGKSRIDLTLFMRMEQKPFISSKGAEITDDEHLYARATVEFGTVSEKCAVVTAEKIQEYLKSVRERLEARREEEALKNRLLDLIPQLNDVGPDESRSGDGVVCESVGVRCEEKKVKIAVPEKEEEDGGTGGRIVN